MMVNLNKFEKLFAEQLDGSKKEAINTCEIGESYWPRLERFITYLHASVFKKRKISLEYC